MYEPNRIVPFLLKHRKVVLEIKDVHSRKLRSESAMVFRIHGSPVSVGLVGLPMLSVTLEAISENREADA